MYNNINNEIFDDFFLKEKIYYFISHFSNFKILMEKEKDYIERKKDLQKALLSFIQGEEEESEEKSNELDESIKGEDFKNNRGELKLFLHLLLRIANDFHRSLFFFQRIEKIFQLIKSYIRYHLTNSELLELFAENKRILLLLIENRILNLDEEVISYLKTKIDINGTKFCHFFYPEIKKIEQNQEFTQQIEKELIEMDEKIFINFEEKRKIGENDSFICGLIRNDSVQDFISHINYMKISLSGKIKTSIFETNLFLLENKNQSLIEYASFFGSSQIIKYLYDYNVEVTPSLFMYAIHGNNHQFIHFLEERCSSRKNINYDYCFAEAIKCHHNELAKYFNDNFLESYPSTDSFELIECKEIPTSIKRVASKSFNLYGVNFAYIFQYYNYYFFPSSISEKCLKYLCLYDYLDLVKHLLENKKNYEFQKVVLKYFNFLIKFQIDF